MELGQQDPESLLQVAPASRRNDEGPSVADARDPAQSQQTSGERGADCAGEVGPPLAPIDAGTAEYPAAVTSLFDVDAESMQEGLAGGRERGAIVAELEMVACPQGIGEPNTEPAGDVVVAQAGSAHVVVDPDRPAAWRRDRG